MTEEAVFMPIGWSGRKQPNKDKLRRLGQMCARKPYRKVQERLKLRTIWNNTDNPRAKNQSTAIQLRLLRRMVWPWNR